MRTSTASKFYYNGASDIPTKKRKPTRDSEFVDM